MTQKKQRATDRTMTLQNRLQNRSYRLRSERSIAKLKKEIGELLLYVQTPLSQNHKQECWAVFDAKLRRRVDLKTRGAIA